MLGNPARTISAKPDGRWAASQAWNATGRTIWIVDAHREGKRFVVRADEMRTAFLELESVIDSHGELERRKLR